MTRLTLTHWRWLGYPLGVAVLVVTSLSWLSDSWHRLSERRESLVSQAHQLADLKEKVAVLQATDVSAQLQNLQFLSQVVPPKKQVWVLVGELKAAASASGAVLDSFRGAVGEVGATPSAKATQTLDLEVTFGVTSGEQLVRLLTVVEESLPLVRVKRVRYQVGKAQMEVEGVWQPLPKVTLSPSQPLPQTTAEVRQLAQHLAGFTSFTEAAASPGAEATQAAEVNPF